jgi:hypothetical protein
MDVAKILDRDVSALSDSKLHNKNRELLNSVLESGTSETAGRSEHVSSE